MIIYMVNIQTILIGEMEISGTGFATRQEPAQGSFVPLETVIRVQFEMPIP